MSILGNVISVKVFEYGVKGGKMWMSEEIAQALCDLAMMKMYGTIHDGTSVSTVDILSASHIVGNARLENGWVTADIAALDTPKGRVLDQMIQAGMVVTGEAVMTGMADPYSYEITELEDARIDVSLNQPVTNTLKDSILSIF